MKNEKIALVKSRHSFGHYVKKERKKDKKK